MKVIILSAGKGTRLGPLTENTPKPLIDLGKGKTLLETQLDNISESGVIDEVILVIGYCAEQIEAKIKKYQRNGMKVRTIYNPFYEVSNNLLSLWMARHEMSDDFIITNGDNIFTPSAFRDLVSKNKNGIFLTTSKRDIYRDDDMKVILINGAVERVSKSILNSEAHAESVGLTLISGEKYSEIFKSNLEDIARDKDYINKFWLEVFNKMIDRGVHIVPFEIEGTKHWVEIDYHGDLNHVIRSLIENKLTYLSDEKSILLTEELKSLETPKLKEDYIEKIVKSLPSHPVELQQMFISFGLTSDESEKLHKIISKY